MIGVTLFGLIFTPVFYIVIRKFFGGKKVASAAPPTVGAMTPAE